MYHLHNEEWLPSLTVSSRCWHHKGLVATSDWIAFLCGYCTGWLHCTKYRVFATIWQKNDHLGSFLWFKVRMNLMHGNTDSISHVFILTWPGMTSSLTSHDSVNDITQHFSLNSFVVLSFDTKMSHLRRRWKFLNANQCYGNLPFVSINVSFKDTIPLQTFPWIFPDPNFIKSTITFDASNGVNVRFVHRVLKVYRAF